jgi:stearoyl-CoA desaturase (Delta-9 desaturase)
LRQADPIVHLPTFQRIACAHERSEHRSRESQSDTHDDIMYPSSVAFILVHLACFGALWFGITWQAIAISVILYWARMFAIGAGYHRYFSHRAYSTGRVFQVVLATMSQSSAQKSV